MNLIEQMSKELRVDKEYIKNIAENNYKYKRYTIRGKKKRREFFHPSKELKTLQYWIVNRIFNKVPISKYVAAYEKGCSIKSNAQIHKYSKYILHTDVRNFFNNITFNHIENLLRKSGFDSEDIEFIGKIVLFEDHLVIGSVSAPRISNCVMYEFDNELFNEISKIQKFNYTRYADDIIISSNKFIPNEIIDIIDQKLELYDLKRNLSKTYFMNKKGRRIVTGVTIDNNTNCLTLGHRKQKELKKMIYNYLVKGEGDFNKLRGYLAFLKDINEGSYIKLRETYKSYGDVTKLFV